MTNTSTTDTPRTDAALSHDGNWDTKALRMANLARQLERELDRSEAYQLAARNDAFNLANALSRAEAEVERLRGQLIRAVEIAETGLEWIAGDPTDSYSELEQIKKSLNPTDK